jgi:hypothetical protein
MARCRPTYEPPISRDLSGLSASGQVTQGWCLDGSTPASITCRNGPTPTESESFCSPTGYKPTQAACATGGIPKSGCDLGSIANT